MTKIKNQYKIIGAGICLVALLMPLSITAIAQHEGQNWQIQKQQIGNPGQGWCTGEDNGGGPVPPPPPPPQPVPETITYNIGDDLVEGTTTVGDTTYTFNGEQPPGDSGFAGCLEALNGNLYASSIPFVHTYTELEQPCEGIYVDLFVRENRPGRLKASLYIPTIDLYYSDQWHLGWVLGGKIIWEDETIPTRRWVGTYFIYIIRPGATNDVTYLYRNNLYYYEESSRDDEHIYFQYVSTTRSAVGIWFYDLPPYTEYK